MKIILSAIITILCNVKSSIGQALLISWKSLQSLIYTVGFVIGTMLAIHSD